MSNEWLAYGLIIITVIAIIVLPKVIKTIIYRGADEIHNAVVRSQEAKNPPKEESLADRYK